MELIGFVLGVCSLLARGAAWIPSLLIEGPAQLAVSSKENGNTLNGSGRELIHSIIQPQLDWGNELNGISFLLRLREAARAPRPMKLSLFCGAGRKQPTPSPLAWAWALLFLSFIGVFAVKSEWSRAHSSFHLEWAHGSSLQKQHHKRQNKWSEAKSFICFQPYFGPAAQWRLPKRN